MAVGPYLQNWKAGGDLGISCGHVHGWQKPASCGATSEQMAPKFLHFLAQVEIYCAKRDNRNGLRRPLPIRANAKRPETESYIKLLTNIKMFTNYLKFNTQLAKHGQ